jgi:hypothetical protein
MAGMDSIDVAQHKDRWRALVNMIMNCWVLENVGKFLSSYTTGSFLERLT